MVFCKERSGEGLFSKPVKIWTKGLDGQTVQFKADVQTSLMIGPPRNLTIYNTDEGYLITWEPPDRRLDELRIYIVRWYQGPNEYIQGSAETKNTSYLSEIDS